MEQYQRRNGREAAQDVYNGELCESPDCTGARHHHLAQSTSAPLFMLTLSDFDFDLPPELIAQTALPDR
ncbi:S-adenosylmethionine:tRNA ribosyltransferase-isomerase, partial [Ralstonia sp. NT80]|uniref:S-adenosylmethionine:tRNA ribosyltransferase-isomerase n=1 Tax=Ralstonia sp. NT80 TaxID=1218247 RepID=UPI001E28463D